MLRMTLHEKCPNMEIFLVRIFLYSVQIQENTDQKKSYLNIFHAVLKLEEAAVTFRKVFSTK